ncbi:hypothetical protein BDW22DRAFT_502893 [Trametopsis cervina]|nr:hypothetical protein BDW22DRAFT_502893 [Trametopsis cervina]
MLTASVRCHIALICTGVQQCMHNLRVIDNLSHLSMASWVYHMARYVTTKRVTFNALVSPPCRDNVMSTATIIRPRRPDYITPAYVQRNPHGFYQVLFWNTVVYPSTCPRYSTSLMALTFQGQRYCHCEARYEHALYKYQRRGYCRHCGSS